jgi:hypothetical protein
MKRLILAFCMMLSAAGAFAQTADAALKQQVNAFIDEWHDDAAHARPAYFDKMAKDSVYIGTDKTELWHKDEFKVWSKKYFDRPSAWKFKNLGRNVYASADKHIIWFDELLETTMGICRGSGVIHRTPTGFEVEHYALSLAVPNDVTTPVIKMIKDFEAKPATK